MFISTNEYKKLGQLSLFAMFASNFEDCGSAAGTLSEERTALEELSSPWLRRNMGKTATHIQFSGPNRLAERERERESARETDS